MRPPGFSKCISANTTTLNLNICICHLWITLVGRWLFKFGICDVVGLILLRATQVWSFNEDSTPARWVNTLRAGGNGQHFADDIFKRIFFNANVWTLIKISLKFVPKGRINNIQEFVQLMAWPRPGDNPLSEPMTDSLFTLVCIIYGLHECSISNQTLYWHPIIKPALFVHDEARPHFPCRVI